MAKRPSLSAHLRLADPPPPGQPDREPAATPQAPRPDAPDRTEASPPPARAPEDLLHILADAGAEMTHLGWLGWSKGWEVHQRLTRYWLGLDRQSR